MTQIRQMTTDYLYKEETDGIIEAFYDVYNALGYGFLERVYQNAFFKNCNGEVFCVKFSRRLKFSLKAVW